jgi:3',5'-cyclic-AMP phosphodiesterase
MTPESSKQANGTLKVLQFTDMHFFKDSSGKLLGVDTAASFAEVYKEAVSRHGIPDLYLLTGDISQDETEASYRRFAQSMQAAGAPCYFIPGNHDRFSEMDSTLRLNGSYFRPQRQIILDNWQIVLLDTHIEGEVGGHLERQELEFLQKCLSESPDLHALICLHHHPVKMGARWLDQIGIDNVSFFWSVMRAHKNVKGVLFGHVHQEFEDRRDGLTMLATPSTCVQFKSGTDEFGVDAVPPGYRWLELEPSGLIRSAVVRIEKVDIGLELSSAGY